MKLVMLMKQVRSPNRHVNIGHLRIGEGIVGAGVPSGWATESGGSFGGGIRNVVITTASTFEGVVKSDPVTSRALVLRCTSRAARRSLPNFVSKSPSEVVSGSSPTGDGRVQDGNAIHFRSIDIHIWGAVAYPRSPKPLPEAKLMLSIDDEYRRTRRWSPLPDGVNVQSFRPSHTQSGLGFNVCRPRQYIDKSK